jgi:hypothetical protein
MAKQIRTGYAEHIEESGALSFKIEESYANSDVMGHVTDAHGHRAIMELMELMVDCLEKSPYKSTMFDENSLKRSKIKKEQIEEIYVYLWNKVKSDLNTNLQFIECFTQVYDISYTKVYESIPPRYKEYLIAELDVSQERIKRLLPKEII